MKKLMLFFVGLAFVTSAAEYGHFSRTHTTNEWSHAVILNEGDRFVALNGNDSAMNYGKSVSVSLSVTYENIQVSRYIDLYYMYLRNDNGIGVTGSENLATITGPCTLIPRRDDSNIIIDYKIIRAYEENELSKYNASLNADGSRLAVALKQAGSNAVTRVYEFDGSSWSQLGDDVE